MQDNPFFQVIYGSLMVIFYVPLIIFGIYWVLGWLFDHYDSR